MKDQAEFPDLVKFAARLREVRKARGKNQTDFARMGGVGLGSQSRYEKAETEPGVAYLALLAQHDVDVGYLLTGRISDGSIDPDLSAVASAVSQLSDRQRVALLTFLATIAPTASKSD